MFLSHTCVRKTKNKHVLGRTSPFPTLLRPPSLSPPLGPFRASPRLRHQLLVEARLRQPPFQARDPTPQRDDSTHPHTCAGSMLSNFVLHPNVLLLQSCCDSHAAALRAGRLRRST